MKEREKLRRKGERERERSDVRGIEMLHIHTLKYKTQTLLSLLPISHL